MKTLDAIKLVGNKAKLAKVLGVSRPAVTQYKEVLPKKRVVMLRELHPEWFATVRDCHDLMKVAET